VKAGAALHDVAQIERNAMQALSRIGA